MKTAYNCFEKGRETHEKRKKKKKKTNCLQEQN